MVNGLLRDHTKGGKFCLVDGFGGMNCPAAGPPSFAQLIVLTIVSVLARRLQAERWATAWESWWRNANDGAALASGTGFVRGER
jgi:hypothetical protein